MGDNRTLYMNQTADQIIQETIDIKGTQYHCLFCDFKNTDQWAVMRHIVDNHSDKLCPETITLCTRTEYRCPCGCICHSHEGAVDHINMIKDSEGYWKNDEAFVHFQHGKCMHYVSSDLQRFGGYYSGDIDKFFVPLNGNRRNHYCKPLEGTIRITEEEYVRAVEQTIGNIERDARKKLLGEDSDAQ